MSDPVTPEFSRPYAVSAVGPEGRTAEVEAGHGERALLASRFGLPAIESLRCRFLLRPLRGGALSADGVLEARVRQVCVITGDEFESVVTEPFVLHFVPESALSEEIDVDAPDEIPIVGSHIDLGEAAAEQLALALDPYPRHPDLPDTADLTEEPPPGAATEAPPARPSPFAVLKRRA
ncbi:YceD family protein [Acidisphaera rubrifaciens]|uniref:DUF177 domain-containing protein n=1 Tax=Acidisphaera rubrifaciens HS-AP3 TaxID=1231350 RepID=A0A0D6P7A5_9PROT|nr:YceD family protein [Acidisphaera rubrifaciens]GAN77093.1 hypothetical protein Asru_0232_06 [Acidisphaera rubrifaciens HS-AP3]